MSSRAVGIGRTFTSPRQGEAHTRACATWKAVAAEWGAYIADVLRIDLRSQLFSLRALPLSFFAAARDLLFQLPPMVGANPVRLPAVDERLAEQ